MSRPILYSLFILIVSVVLLVTALQKQTSAQVSSYAGVVPFATSGGMLGLFDSKDGTIYLYEPNLVECLQVIQVEALGKPLKRIK